MTYFAVYSLLLLSRLIDRGRGASLLYHVLLIGLFLFSALRFEVGCDWPNYLLNFSIQKWRTFEDALMERNPAHWLLLELVDQLGLGYIWFNVATSAIFFIGLNSVAVRSPSPIAVLVLCFPILILNMPMAAVKQAAAIGLLCFSFNAFIERKPLQFAIWVILAASFHTSAVTFLLLILFINGNFSVKRLVVGGLLAIPGLIVILASESAETASQRYIDSDLQAGGAIFRVGLLAASGLFYLFYLSKRWRFVFPASHTFFSMMALGMVLLLPLVPISSVISDRIGYFFVVPQVLIFAAIPALKLRQSRQIIAFLPYIALTILFAGWTTLSAHYARCYSPYSMTLPD